MAHFKDPTFQERAGQASDARRDALEQLRRRPAPDQALVFQRKQTAERRSAARAEKALAKEVAEQAAKSAKAKATLSVPTEAERKAGRDARYAARKGRR